MHVRLIVTMALSAGDWIPMADQTHLRDISFSCLYQTRNRAVRSIHAGIRPGVSLCEQTDTDLMSIRSEFISHNALHEKVIVHGHTPTHPIEILPNRINVDTHAYETGVLSCLVLEGSSYRVIEA